jgi:hypothetical protein
MKKHIVVVQKHESVEDQIETFLNDGHTISRPNKYVDIIIAIQSAHILIIDPAALKQKFQASRVISEAKRRGLKVIQCVPNEDPSDEIILHNRAVC